MSYSTSAFGQSVAYRARRYTRLCSEFFRGVRDQHRLATTLPQLGVGAEEFERWRKELQEPYRLYCQKASIPEMAMSLNTGATLAALIQASKAKRVADLGSGFSSYVSRVSAPDAEVWSVDDDPSWLEVTSSFLAEHGVRTDGLVVWQDFQQSAAPGTFDVVSHDLGSMDVRLSTLPKVIRMLAPQRGWLLLDDMHKVGYSQPAWTTLKESEFTCYSLRAATCDALGRFAVLAQRRS